MKANYNNRYALTGTGLLNDTDFNKSMEDSFEDTGARGLKMKPIEPFEFEDDLGKKYKVAYIKDELWLLYWNRVYSSYSTLREITKEEAVSLQKKG